MPARLVIRGKGRTVRRTLGQMNRYEREYSLLLDGLKAEGKVLWWAFDAIKLRLAELTFYTPDFIIMLADGEIEIHDVKGGFIEDDAIVKVKVAATLFPFPFVVAQKKRKADPWTYRRFGDAKDQMEIDGDWTATTKPSFPCARKDAREIPESH